MLLSILLTVPVSIWLVPCVYQVGMLALTYPDVNFQVASETAHKRLLQLVRETMDKHQKTNVEESLTSVTADKISAFKVI